MDVSDMIEKLKESEALFNQIKQGPYKNAIIQAQEVLVKNTDIIKSM
jgi:hypothetical protein